MHIFATASANSCPLAAGEIYLAAIEAAKNSPADLRGCSSTR